MKMNSSALNENEEQNEWKATNRREKMWHIEAEEEDETTEKDEEKKRIER